MAEQNAHIETASVQSGVQIEQLAHDADMAMVRSYAKAKQLPQEAVLAAGMFGARRAKPGGRWHDVIVCPVRRNDRTIAGWQWAAQWTDVPWQPMSDGTGLACWGSESLERDCGLPAAVVLVEGMSDYAAMCELNYSYVHNGIEQPWWVVGAVGTGGALRSVRKCVAGLRQLFGEDAQDVPFVIMLDGDADPGKADSKAVEAAGQRKTLGQRAVVLSHPTGCDLRDTLRIVDNVYVCDRIAAAAEFACAAAAGVVSVIPVVADDEAAAQRIAQVAAMRKAKQEAAAVQRASQKRTGKHNADYGKVSPADVAERCESRRAGDGKWRAKCPAHNGDGYHLSILTGSGGGAILTCHSEGCDWRDILRSVGLWREAKQAA